MSEVVYATYSNERIINKAFLQFENNVEVYILIMIKANIMLILNVDEYGTNYRTLQFALIF